MTSKKQLRVQDYIEHIIGAITRIEAYVKDLCEVGEIAMRRDYLSLWPFLPRRYSMAP